MFKLIPNVAKGSWVIKQSVGHSPVLLGNKLKTHYFRCAPSLFQHSSPLPCPAGRASKSPQARPTAQYAGGYC